MYTTNISIQVILNISFSKDLITLILANIKKKYDLFLYYEYTRKIINVEKAVEWIFNKNNESSSIATLVQGACIWISFNTSENNQTIISIYNTDNYEIWEKRVGDSDENYSYDIPRYVNFLLDLCDNISIQNITMTIDE